MTTAVESTDRRFAWIAQHGGPVVAWADPHSSHRHGVVGDGLAEWHASDRESVDKPASLRKHADGAAGTRMMEIRLAYQPEATNEPVHWDSTLIVGEGRYVRVHGKAKDFPSALTSAETLVHEYRQIGGLTWWLETEDHWVSWLGAFGLRATKIASSGSDPYWHFEVSGDAPTLEEAALLASFGRAPVSGSASGPGA